MTQPVAPTVTAGATAVSGAAAVTGTALAMLPEFTASTAAWHDPNDEIALTRSLLLACFPDHDPASIVLWEGGGSISPR